MAEVQSDKAALPEKSRVVVGLDFGTTYSGFAFAHVSNPDKIYTFYDYPKSAGEKPYCKTLTACYYKPVPPAGSSANADQKGSWTLQSWGYLARTDYERDIQALHKYRKSQDPPLTSAGSSHSVQKFLSRYTNLRSSDGAQPGASTVAPQISQPPSVGVFLLRFKLHLASRRSEAASSASPLPPGLTIEQVITDYLRELGALVLKHLQSKYGAHFSSEMIQWCITVPSIWDNYAKATMKKCMGAAGLMSPNQPVTIVLEPEAASFHCQRVMSELVLEAGNKLLVADVGGGTSDIVVQEVVKPGCSVKEVTVSSGGLCGGTYVDSRFMEFLEGRVGPCFPECILKHRNVYGQLMKEWECIKSFFDRGQGVTTMNLPNKLAVEWERSDVESDHPGSQEYDELEMSYEEVQSIFDPVVEQNVDLIQRQMVEAGGKVRVLALVGGFSESPYLLRRMEEAFGAMTESIICPPNPGSAICQGAVALALNPKAVVSRICKRTYGYAVKMLFEKDVDPIEKLYVAWDGTEWCRDRLRVLVEKGDVVVMDEPMTALCHPIDRQCRSVVFRLFSCDDTLPPRYATDVRLQKEGKLWMDISGDMELDTFRNIEISLCFGGTCLEVKARAVNFNAHQVQLPVEIDYLLH